TLELMNNEFRVKETKTKASRRRVKLAPETVEILMAHKEKMQAKGNNSPLVFCTRTGGFLRAVNVRRSLRTSLEKAKLPVIRFHDLRHTCATLLLLANVHVKVVSERLGHSKIQITLDTYSHVLPAMQDQAVQVMSGMLFQKPQAGGDDD